MTSIVVADDHDMVRHGFRMVLSAQPDLTVVGEARDGDSAWELVRHLRPAVLLTDIRMPGTDGLELTRRVANAPDLPTRVIVVTTFNEDEYVARALRDGASGFLLKASAPGLLVEAVRAALAGNALVSPEVTVRLLERLRTDRTVRQPSPPLTPREREVAQLVARGLSNDEIAVELRISPGTAKTHVAHLSMKLGNLTRVGVVAWAWESGLVSRL
ncbi:response regulator transcription factor [Plantactinospora sp. S1510]|uniref:Response regulator transcription factor n=1 Tax=Plantactinospora alkalitolerans TaxID=2789879 RepID=A0ABS0GVR9_9ACTN|nr:response regulator transcription factor [Plantactinospora alkalitolerans]MBF9130285.1 response regulator transcription factor [Plantactinospora alkalitolerans]